MLISLTGPSGVGKGYVKERILQRFHGIVELVWTTTRPLRINEQVGANRKSIAPEKFTSLHERELLVCVQALHGHFYALEKSELERCQGAIGLTETNISNMGDMSRLVADFLPIALIPSDLGFLRERLTRYRGEKEGEDLESRLLRAKKEVRQIRASQQFVLVVEVSKENETQVPQQVLAFLEERVRQVKGGRT